MALDVAERLFDLRPQALICDQQRSVPSAQVLQQAHGTVEPVFANIQNKGMGRFTLRGRHKVNTHRKLFTLVHNIEKITRGPRT